MTNFRESEILKLLASGRVRRPGVVEGVDDQDDCAVLALPAGRELCATTDFVRGTGFTLHKLGHLSFADLGRYVVVANVSDLAAMGATPIAYLSVVRYGPDRTLDEVSEMLKGIDAACLEFDCPLVGGDSGSYGADVLSGTALGLVPTGRRLSRNTMQEGDAVYVSGQIGGAAAALAAGLGDVAAREPAAFKSALTRWSQPQPRTHLGRALVDLGFRVSAMDVSDGLTASLQQLTRITGLGFIIEAAKLPISEDVRSIADALGTATVHLACSASVDFELLVGCPPQRETALLEAANAAETPLTRIGTCVGGGAISMTKASGGPYEEMPGAPWDHQTHDVARMFDARP